MEYFSEMKRLHFWRAIRLIFNEQLRIKCSSLIAEKDGVCNERMRQRFITGVKDGELRPEASERALYLYFVMTQGILNGMLLYPKAMVENTMAAQVFEAY